MQYINLLKMEGDKQTCFFTKSVLPKFTYLPSTDSPRLEIQGSGDGAKYSPFKTFLRVRHYDDGNHNVIIRKLLDSLFNIRLEPKSSYQISR
jgi:hypothetical protein